jgi:hypothetical protein
MSVSMILLIVLIVVAIATIPAWPHSRTWGFVPVGAIGAVLLVVIVLMLMGRI